MVRKIQPQTRRDIFDAIKIERVVWCGKLEEADFLSRIFDLKKLPSTDARYPTMYSDVWQHRTNNDDWDFYWVLSDPRLDLLNCEDELFLQFLCEMLHPVVRVDSSEAERLTQFFNEALKRDGFELTERTRIAGRSVYSARALPKIARIHLEKARSALVKADSSYVAQQITRMELAVESDAGLAVGAAKELVETVCKTILEERGITVDKNWDIPQLVRHTSRELELTPDDIADTVKASDTIRRVLGSLATITQGVAELRNAYGTGHGRSANTRGLQPRHARLAVGSAATLAVFLIETHNERPKSGSS